MQTICSIRPVLRLIRVHTEHRRLYRVWYKESIEYTEYTEYSALCLVISYVNCNDNFNCGTLQKVYKLCLKSKRDRQRETGRAEGRTGKPGSIVVKEKDDESTFIFTLIKLKYVVVKCTT